MMVLKLFEGCALRLTSNITVEASIPWGTWLKVWGADWGSIYDFPFQFYLFIIIIFYNLIFLRVLYVTQIFKFDNLAQSHKS